MEGRPMSFPGYLWLCKRWIFCYRPNSPTAGTGSDHWPLCWMERPAGKWFCRHREPSWVHMDRKSYVPFPYPSVLAKIKDHEFASSRLPPGMQAGLQRPDRLWIQQGEGQKRIQSYHVNLRLPTLFPGPVEFINCPHLSPRSRMSS